MNKTKQYVLALLCGMDADHEMRRGIEPDAGMAESMIAGVKLTKADILAEYANRRSFFEFAETWKALPRLIKIVQDGGSRMAYTDFLHTLPNGRTLLRTAEDLNVLDRAFLPELWVGHMREMEKVWYKADRYKRNRHDFTDICRAVAALEGRRLREDELADAGIKRSDMYFSVRGGNIEKVAEQLKAAGMTLKADDLLFLDDYGDNAMDTAMAWSNAGRMFKTFADHGVRFEPWHFLHACADRKSILEMALEPNHKGAKHLFSAVLWAGRPEAMMELYAHVPADKRDQIDLPSVLDVLYDDMYGPVVDMDGMSAQDLVTSLNGDGQGRIIPLGLKTVWDAMPALRERLKNEGQTIGMDDLRLTSGPLNETCLMQAVRFGKLDQVMAIMADGNARLSYDDLMTVGEGQTESLLRTICRAGQQRALLDPVHWIGRGAELFKVWNAMNEDDRKGIGFKNIHSEVNRLTLRDRFGGAYRQTAVKKAAGPSI